MCAFGIFLAILGLANFHNFYTGCTPSPFLHTRPAGTARILIRDIWSKRGYSYGRIHGPAARPLRFHSPWRILAGFVAGHKNLLLLLGRNRESRQSLAASDQDTPKVH